MKVLPFFILLFLNVALLTQPRPNVEVPEEMKKLDFLIGEWNVHANTLDPKGNVVYESDFIMTFRKEMNGMLILAKTGRIDEEGHFNLGQRTWYFFDRHTEKYMDVNFDIVGNFEIKTGNFTGSEFETGLSRAKVGSRRRVQDLEENY